MSDLPTENIETLVWNVTEVPGDVYTGLWKAGIINDQYFSRNIGKTHSVQHYKLWYAKKFNLTRDIKNQLVRIILGESCMSYSQYKIE